MDKQLKNVQSYIYTDPQGENLEILFLMDPDKKGFLNATSIAKHFEKEPAQWLQNRNTHKYVKELINSTNTQSKINTINQDDLVINNKSSDPTLNGTWLHPKLGTKFAHWLSVHFGAWCEQQIIDLVYNQTASDANSTFAQLEKYLEQTDYRFYTMEQRIGQYINQRFDAIETRLNANNQPPNQFQEHLFKETRYDSNLSLADKTDTTQQSKEENLKTTLLKHQQNLESVLKNHPDELIQQRLAKIREYTNLIVQHKFSAPGKTLDQDVLIGKILELRKTGESWTAIAQHLNDNNISTVTGIGSWYGSSVKRYILGKSNDPSI